MWSRGTKISTWTRNNIHYSTPCEGASTIWGTGIKTQAHLAALINGASSSHLEYDSHDSMIPATIALGEELSSGGESILQSMKLGYFTGEILKKYSLPVSKKEECIGQRTYQPSYLLLLALTYSICQRKRQPMP